MNPFSGSMGGGALPFTAQASGSGDDPETTFKTVYEGIVMTLSDLERKRNASVQVLAVSHALTNTSTGYTCTIIVSGMLISAPPSLPFALPKGNLR